VLVFTLLSSKVSVFEVFVFTVLGGLARA
jgi:hypothetical protein